MDSKLINLLKEAYNTAEDADKKTLSEKFGAQFFSSKITDRILSVEDAGKEIGIGHLVVPYPHPHPTNNRQDAANAFFKLDIIAEALREGIALDWTNDNQKKWHPWFTDYKPGSGFRFCDSYYGCAIVNSLGGSRLCLDTKEKAEYFGKQFIDLWNQFLNPNN